VTVTDPPDERMLDTSISAADLIGTSVHDPLPSRARVVVVGGGIVGAATALHLALAGESDVLLVDRFRVASGTTWHAAGLLARVRGTHALSDLADYGVETYRDLESRTGLPVAFNANGSLTLARHPGRVHELRTAQDLAHSRGVAADLVPPDQIADIHPMISSDGVLAALFQPGDAMVNPGWAAAALVRQAHALGVAVRESVDVRSVVISGPEDRRRAVGVETSAGTVDAELVVLCCGLWTRELAAAAGAVVPLYAAEHVHVTTGPVPGASPLHPLVRDLDGSLYVRHHRGALVVGAFEPHGKPRATSEISTAGHAEFPADWDHFAPVRAAAERVLPVLRDSTYERFLCAPESFTPDVTFCLGETPEVSGLFVGAGFNSQGIIYAPGAGRALADWVLNGAPGFDASDVDVARFAAAQGNRAYLHERTKESLGRLYAMHWPHVQSEAARGLRRTPLTDRLVAHGGRLGETRGWERPLFFGTPGDDAPLGYSFTRPRWWEAVAAEHRAAREAVAFFDLSAFGTFEVTGTDATEVLQRLCTADVDVAVGRAVYTLALTSRGGILLDGTVMRLAADRYRVVVPSFTQRAAWWWLRRAASGRACTVSDTTSGEAVLHVAGPAAVELMRRLTPDEGALADLPRFGVRRLEVGRAFADVARVSFTGSRGYEIYVSSDQAVDVLESVLDAGADLGVRPAGTLALDSLRAEVGYRHLGHDLGPGDGPASVGMTRFVAAHKEFVGRQALAARDERRRQVFVLLDDPEPTLWHGEPVLVEGRFVGHVTSGAYGHTLGAACGLATVDPEVVEGLPPDRPAPAEVLVLGARVPARIGLDPFLAPTG
jgi:4-methylaminobutanoate oxidase (formaldehyde-forming)